MKIIAHENAPCARWVSGDRGRARKYMFAVGRQGDYRFDCADQFTHACHMRWRHENRSRSEYRWAALVKQFEQFGLVGLRRQCLAQRLLVKADAKAFAVESLD
ncbi:hypothetical protein [Halopseudomonas pelagia]|uniref:hypothetical protein n=1 Tax=Halopseudomonas pelagia TaxID=553151 RepID=UPI001F3E76B1|nr:hypothetical protein [Halopseudomonas pelagia]